MTGAGGGFVRARGVAAYSSASGGGSARIAQPGGQGGAAVGGYSAGFQQSGQDAPVSFSGGGREGGGAFIDYQGSLERGPGGPPVPSNEDEAFWAQADSFGATATIPEEAEQRGGESYGGGGAEFGFQEEDEEQWENDTNLEQLPQQHQAEGLQHAAVGVSVGRGGDLMGQQHEQLHGAGQHHEQHGSSSITAVHGPWKGVSLEMILKGRATSLRRTKGEDPRKFLARVTHLQLERHELTVLAEQKKLSAAKAAKAAVAAGDEEQKEAPVQKRPLPLNGMVPNLRTVYAYENKIVAIGPLGERVEQLYLQSNRLGEMGSWSRQFPKLKLLSLDRNRIRCLEGLDRSQYLEELSLARQRLPEGVPCLGFDPMAIRALSRSLERLDVSGNQIVDLSPLAGLSALSTLSATENRISRIEGLDMMLQHCQRLRTLDVRENPIARQNVKYRDEIILCAQGPLQEVDGKDVTEKEKEFVKQLAKRKEARRASKERSSMMMAGGVVPPAGV